MSEVTYTSTKNDKDKVYWDSTIGGLCWDLVHRTCCRDYTNADKQIRISWDKGQPTIIEYWDKDTCK